MSDVWNILPAINDNKPLPDRWIKYLWENISQLANPIRALQQGQLTSHIGNFDTTSSTFVKVDTVFSQNDFYATGRDFLFLANIMAWATASGGSMALDLDLDDVSISSGVGIAYIGYHIQPSGQFLAYPFFNVPAGKHTINLKYRLVLAVGAARVTISTNRNWFYIVEF